MELDLASVNLPMLLDNCATLVRERASRQGLTLALEVDERPRRVGRRRQRKLKQVVSTCSPTPSSSRRPAAA